MMTPERMAETRGRRCELDGVDASELLDEIDRLHTEIEALVEKYDKEKIKDEFDCCGCSKPWVLYDEVMRNIRKLVGRDVV